MLTVVEMQGLGAVILSLKCPFQSHMLAPLVLFCAALGPLGSKAWREEMGPLGGP